MSKKGIVIDVGFAADVKNFVNDIESQFKNVNFNDMLGLSDAFDKQAKDVRNQLSKLKTEIDEVINGNVKNDPSKQIQALNKSVNTLAVNFKEMVKAMPMSESGKLTAELDGIISDMNELSNVCDNATNAIKKVSDVANGDIKFTSKEQSEELNTLLATFQKLVIIAKNVDGQLAKKSDKTHYANTKEVLDDIIISYKKYMDIENRVVDLEENNTLTNSQKVKEMDKLNQQYLETSINLQRLFTTYRELGGNEDVKVNFDGYKIAIQNVREDVESQFDTLLSYVSKRQAEIQQEIYNLGGNNLSKVTKSISSNNKNKITVPLDISTRSSTLLKTALGIIEDVQSKLVNNPLQVQVALVSPYKTKRNSEILEQITGSLDNIQDGEIKNKLSNLIENLNKQFGNELHIKVEVEGSEKSKTAVKGLISELQAQIDSADFVVRPEIELTNEAKTKLQKDIDDLSKGVVVNIGVKDENGEDAGSNSTRGEIKTINTLRKQIDLVKTSIENKAQAFQDGEATVTDVIGKEISLLDSLQKKLEDVTGAINNKTEAFKNEQQVVRDAVNDEINTITPLQDLESSYNNFKSFYDNNDLESEAGAKAALSYYNAYKEALISKANKKELQKFTIGKTSDLFTGNYADYKKGAGNLDLSGLNSEITKYQEVIDKFNQPEVISIINSLTEAIEKLLAAGNNSAEATALLKNLNSVINNLGGKNSAEKIERVVTNLENFQKSVQSLDISDSGFVKSLSSILEKGEALKSLGEVLKSTKKQIDAAEKAVKTENNLKQAQEYLEKYENDIYEAVNKKSADKNETVIYQQLKATKDGLVQVIALVKEANNEYKKYIYTTTNGSDVMQAASSKDQAALANEIKRYETYQKLKQLAVPGATNLGKEGVTFTPDSENWDKLIDKAKEFGIEAENIVKIIRNVDRLGQESFQIFTNLSRVTVGMDSNGVLFQKDDVFNKGEIEGFKKEILSLQKLLKDSFKGNDLNTENFLNALDKISSKWKELAHLNKNNPELISDEELNNLSNYYEVFKTTLSSISLDKISTDNKTPEFIAQLKQAEQQLELVKIVLDKVNAGEAFSEEDINQVKEFITQMRTLYSTAGDKENKLANQAGANNLLGKIADTLSKNTAMSKELRQEFQLLSAEIQSFGDKLPSDKLQEFGARFKALDAQMKMTGQTGLSFFDGIIKRAKSMSQSFISMYLSLWDIVRYIRTGLTYIKELDTALTEMRKVSDETVKSLKNFQKASFDMANSVGTTAVQIQNSTADFMRLGETLDDATESAKTANILLNVSEFESIDEATESLVAMGAAYDELEKSDIVDKLNQVGNNFAISTDGLATALQRSASALKTAGNDMDEAVALVTAGNQVVQDPDSVGAGLRTISLRISGTKAAKEELESLGEDTSDFIVQTVAKSQETIKNFTKVASNNFEGFDILDDNGNFKSTYEILLGIAEIYEEIVETDKEYGTNMSNGLLEALAGKNRANIAASILQSPEILKSAYESSAYESEGSAQKELDKYLDSIEGKIQQFTNELQEFWYNLISSETVKAVIDAGTKILDILGNIVDKLGTVGTAAAVAGAAFGLKAVKNGGGRAKEVCPQIAKYATESFSREVCEFWCILE